MLGYFLPVIILLGIITSYGDIKFGKIRNKWIISSLIYALVVYLVLIIYYSLTTGINSHYIWELVTNVLFVISLGFGMWYFGLWTAGDGKLFIAFSALIPLSVYKYGYQEWIPSITLLMNIFILGLVFMLGIILFRSKLKGLKKLSIDFFKNFFQVEKLLSSIIYIFAIFWIVKLSFLLIGIEPSYIVRMVLTLILMSLLQKNSNKKYSIYLVLVISIIRLFVDSSVYSLIFLKEFLIILFVWKFVKSFIQECVSGLGEELFSEEVKVKDLKPGMLLREYIEEKTSLTKTELDEIRKKNLKVIKTKGVYYILKPKVSFRSNDFIDEEAEGLTREDIAKIKQTGIKKVKVTQTIPFAPLIFGGVILTLIANGNILIVIKSLF